MSDFQFQHSYGRILGVAHTALVRHLAKLMKAKNLPISPEQFSVLSHLWQKDGRSQNELAICTNRNRANVTRVIDILERDGIVERRDHPQDRRVFNIFLTEKGKALEKEAAACAKQSIEDALKGSSDEEKAILLKVLKQTIENLT